MRVRVGSKAPVDLGCLGPHTDLLRGGASSWRGEMTGAQQCRLATVAPLGGVIRAGNLPNPSEIFSPVLQPAAIRLTDGEHTSPRHIRIAAPRASRGVSASHAIRAGKHANLLQRHEIAGLRSCCRRAARDSVKLLANGLCARSPISRVRSSRL